MGNSEKTAGCEILTTNVITPHTGIPEEQMYREANEREGMAAISKVSLDFTEDKKTPAFLVDEQMSYMRCVACDQDVIGRLNQLSAQAAFDAKILGQAPDLSRVNEFVMYHAKGDCIREQGYKPLGGSAPVRECINCGRYVPINEDHDCRDVKPGEAPATIIPREHQSSPKEHWADKEIQLAAQEIVDGKFRVRDDPNEFWNYGETMTVAQHPRVKEAMRKLEQEMEGPSNEQEYLEKYQMLHELNEAANKPNQWDGQGRWIGAENEEMRKGMILSPFAFMQKLCAIVGERRVELNKFGVLGRVHLLSPDPNYVESAIFTLGPKDQRPEHMKGKCVVGTLQYPLSTEWMIVRVNQYGVPTTAKYLGWRTALLSMIRLGVLTEKEAHKAFPLGDGPAGDWYREQLYMHRNRRQRPA